MEHEVTNLSSGLPYRNSVGVCLINKRGQVFCAERRDKKGAWQFPQGGIQKGEDPALAVFREMKEEIGTDKGALIAKIDERLRYDFPDYLQYRNGVFRGKYRGQEQLWYAMLFLGEDEDFNLTSEEEPESPEFVAWRWVELADMPSLIVPFKRPVYEVLAQRFAPLVAAIRRGEEVGRLEAAG